MDSNLQLRSFYNKMNSKEPDLSQSSEISNKPSVTGWLCCCIIGIETDECRPRFVPLAIFRDRLSALLYAYSITLSKTEEERGRRYGSALHRSSRIPCRIIEDGTNGYEEQSYRGAHGRLGMTREEKADVERLEAQVRIIEFHYEGLGDDWLRCFFTIDFVHIKVFPLQILNPPTDTISPHVKLTFALWKDDPIGSPLKWMRRHSNIEDRKSKLVWIVIYKCEGSTERPCGKLPLPKLKLVCESEVEYFPFGIPFVSFTCILKRLSTCIAETLPAVSCLDQISSDLIGLIASFLPFDYLVQFLKLPREPRLADSEEELKQLIRFWLPKRTASFPGSSYVPDRSCSLSSSCKATPDLWEAIVKSLSLKYTVNEIPENVNWSSLRIVIFDLPDDLAVRRVVSFLRDKIPSKYLSDGLTYVVQLLVITKADDSKDEKYRDGNWYTTETLKLEFYEVNGLKHCDWYSLELEEEDFSSDNRSIFVLRFEENSTIVHLKKSRSNDESSISPKRALPSGWVTCESNEWDTAGVVVNNLATYLLTSYDQNVSISYERSNTNDSKQGESSKSSSEAPVSIAGVPANQLGTNHSQNMELLLNKIDRYIADGTLRQLWTKIANLFRISNFTFIDHQDQTTPVHTPTDLVVLTDCFFDSRPRAHSAITSDYSTCIMNSAVSTAYRNNSCCLKARQSFNVDVVVLKFKKYVTHSSLNEVRASRHRLEMSIDKMCEIKELELKGINFTPRISLPGVLFDIFASFRHRPLQVECWDRKQESDYPPFRNPFGFVIEEL